MRSGIAGPKNPTSSATKPTIWHCSNVDHTDGRRIFISDGTDSFEKLTAESSASAPVMYQNHPPLSPEGYAPLVLGRVSKCLWQFCLPVVVVYKILSPNRGTESPKLREFCRRETSSQARATHIFVDKKVDMGTRGLCTAPKIAEIFFDLAIVMPIARAHA